MAQTENQKKLLNELFKLDQCDLDFSIYRIMNTKSKEINEFLDNDLLSCVTFVNELDLSKFDEVFVQ